MEELRQRTRPAHMVIEQLPVFAALFEPGYDLVSYGRLLATLHAFYEPVEHALFSDLPPPIQKAVGHRRKAGLLAQDLRALGQRDGRLASPALSLSLADWPLPRKMGGLYVLEGATLGGRLIRRHLADRFGPAIEPALSFYGCYGAGAGAEWASFRSFMAREYDGRPALIDEVVAGAHSLFAALQGWMETERAAA